MRPPVPLVLCYHAVTPSWPHALAVDADTLLGQVRGLLDRGFTPVRPADLLLARRRALHVTFDDAYRRVTDVLPALEQLGVPVTVFASTAYARDGRPFDVPELASEVAAHPDELATMDWGQLRMLAERGVEIGSHTVSHPHLVGLGDAELQRELRDSKEEIETEVGRPCTLLSYPYGEQDGRVREAAKAAGYRAAFTVRSGLGRRDAYAFPRVSVYRADGSLRLRLKTSALRRALPRR